MLLSIGSYDFSDIVAYEVAHKDKTKEVESSSGCVSVYVISEQVIITIGVGALDQAKMSALRSAMSSITFTVNYIDDDGVQKSGTFKRGDRVSPIRSYINLEAFWDEQTITLTSLGGDEDANS